MSNLQQASGHDYPAASRKHCVDARVLSDNQRCDGAAYLAGYAVECIIKTVIQVENKSAKVPHKHDLDDLSSRALLLMALPNSRTARYFKEINSIGIPYKEPPLGWNERLRYHPENKIPSQTANEWVSEAERLYVNVIGGLMKDGEVKL
jgi:hypothetical protein